MRVEIDVYSGRPNPEWDLPANLAAELAARLDALPPATDWRDHDRLGYRGLIVNAEGASEARFARAEVRFGLVRITGADGRSRVARDERRALERWLIEQARGRVPDDLLDFAIGEGGDSPLPR